MSLAASSVQAQRTAGRLRVLALALLALLFLPLAAFAQDLPALTGRVVDDAGLIDPVAETALVQKLQASQAR